MKGRGRVRQEHDITYKPGYEFGGQMNVLCWILPPLGVDSADVHLSLTCSSKTLYAHLKGFFPYLLLVSVSILSRLALVMVL